MSGDVQLSTTLKPHVWDRVRLAVPNLTNGALQVSGLANAGRDTEYTYSLLLSRRDGKRPTKEQIAWAEATVQAIDCVLR